MTHFIRQQYLDVELIGSERDGFALQNRLSGLCRDQMIPAIEKALDSCSTSGELIVIDRLDIDAGTLELDRVEEELINSVVKSLIQGVDQEITARLPGKPGRSISGLMESEALAENDSSGEPEEKLWEAFAYFLKNGCLPWSYRLPASKSLEEVMTELLDHGGEEYNRIPGFKIGRMLKTDSAAKRLDMQFSASFRRRLQQIVFGGSWEEEAPELPSDLKKPWDAFLSLLQNGTIPASYHLPAGSSLEDILTGLLTAGSQEPSMQVPFATIGQALKSDLAARRLVAHFSQDFVSQLLQKQSPNSFKELQHLLEVLDSHSFSSGDSATIRQLVLEKLVLQISTGSTFSTTYFVQQVLGALKHQEYLFPTVIEVFQQAWPNAIREIKGMVSHSDLSEIELIAPNLKDRGEDFATDRPGKYDPIKDEPGEGIYIDNAGMVLLHPFLPQFFEALGISREDEILQPERALGLLHYLTTGQTKLPEYELVLPKLLCGVPPSTTVSIDFEISIEEETEAKALLEAVIKHWEALRDTSPDALRGTFLLRPGKISQKEDGDWLLQVESRSFDVLLDFLPWGISMIKLPWMRNMLWVEWIF